MKVNEDYPAEVDSSFVKKKLIWQISKRKISHKFNV
jgi:hypothetical protein